MNDDTVLYFAYGSNADPDRFRARIGPWLSRRVAFLGGYRLRFASSVRSEGGGGAVVDPWEGGRVAGVLYKITAEQLAAMDREEFGATRNVSLTGRRIAATVSTDDGPQPAQLYTVEDDGGWCPPSARYLGFIVRGLEDAGHSPESLEQVRRIARTEPTGS
jgi:cation transport regulator ChaC